MKKFFITLSMITVSACSSFNKEDNQFTSKVSVPKKFIVSSQNECPNIVPDSERYLYAYNSARKLVIAEYIKNINYALHRDFVAQNLAGGWPSTIEGFESGVNKTNQQIKKSISSYGKEKTRSLLLKANLEM